MSKFKAGDKVRVVVGRSSEHFPFMVEGSVHTVDNSRDGYVHLKGHTEHGWCDFRFELIEAAPKRDYVADHARRTLRAAGVPKDVAAKLVGYIAQGTRYKLSEFSRKLPRSAPDIIISALDWSESKEGWRFWSDAYAAQVKHEQEATANA